MSHPTKNEAPIGSEFHSFLLLFSLSRPVTLTRAAQVAAKRDPFQRAAVVTHHIRSRKDCKTINFIKELYMNSSLFGDVFYAYTPAKCDWLMYLLWQEKQDLSYRL